jgi:hypothetical protein
VKIVTPFMGFLAKASSGRSSTPELSDTKLTVPGVLNLTLEAPLPTFTVFNVPLPGGQNTPTDSWVYAQEIVAGAAGASPVIAFFGPGVWDVSWGLSLIERGAVSDPTAEITLQFSDNLAGTAAILGHINAKFGAAQNQSGRFRFTVTTDSLFFISRASNGGLTTSTSLFLVDVIASRIF